jgi:GDP-L-fucose synthase
MAKTVVFEGELVFDSNKPDGTMQNIMDIGRLKSLGVGILCWS